MSEENAGSEELVVSWSGIYTTLVVSVAQGLIFYLFFVWQRGRDRKKEKNSYDLYEPRQYSREHRSPAPFQKNWWKEAWDISDEETLRCVGLDSFMFLRFLRLGARISLVGSLFAIILIPVYATSENTGKATEQFNSLSLAKVEADGDRLWSPLTLWVVFTAFILREFWKEWVAYAIHRYEFLARGDEEMPKEYRYAIRVERIPYKYRSNAALREYFERLFPGKVKQVTVYFKFEALQKLVDQRQATIEAAERAIAFTMAKPDEPRPTLKLGGSRLCCNLDIADAIGHYEWKIKTLNQEIDSIRRTLVGPVDMDDDGFPDEDIAEADDANAAKRTKKNEKETNKDSDDGEASEVKSATSRDEEGDEPSLDDPLMLARTCSTAFVTFTSLRAKQAAVQCELTGNTTSMLVYPAADHSGILWNNVTVSQPVQKVLKFQAALLWTAGLILWAVVVSSVVAISNLNSILELIGLNTLDEDTIWYGLLAGFIPVFALDVLVYIVYLGIVTVAKYFIRYKSLPEVDSYAINWHMLFQFANLFYVMIGGSLLNQVNSLNEAGGDITETVRVLADAMSGSAIFFINMILYETFGSFGLELSMLPTYGVNLIMGIAVRPEALRTQRMIDEAHKAPSVGWGEQMPPVVFVFLVTIVYMPIVPVIEFFAFLFFVVSYLLWKHQFLHVYAQQFEGGGDATWICLFKFLMASLYIGQVVFIICMALKEAGIQVYLAAIPLVATMIVHTLLYIKIIRPLRYLSLEVAADVDILDGELTTLSTLAPLYAPPALFMDERGPMPYRRAPRNEVKPEEEAEPMV
mmetsp:Transcript_23160/g.38296  ORF Transcript_23160/g.38296 Transcript_23160/m.38296 type:complete len:806 (-) Transcript_23160:71-2488(-)|eukprot:CAMPEP_0119027992 /NCGR_PEP_ID=MMETSP1176-20130426/38114_1 /TAXON_ID=265551 /ORGANISM="Synedropsis recta cf, Strain CCMP1620" /LENGTH=805 /DNA_ID=CAMNT_0006984031 /DNA_START=150 /DNA_END=2567 /DNA_ORIENTATION=+